MKTGLILEGGAMRGLFTAGVLDVLMENAVEFDGMIGVSAGAAFGCNFKSGQIGRTIRYNKRFCKNKEYCSFYSLIKTGDIFGFDFCYNKIPNEYDLFDNEKYNSNPMEFHLVCTDIVTGKPCYKMLGNSYDPDYIKWICASASMPFVSNIMEIEGNKYLDGGVSDSIPVRYFESIGYEKNVVVLTQPKGYIKEKNKLAPFMELKYSKYPNLINAMKNRHNAYNDTIKYIEKREAEGKLFVIRPKSALKVGHIEHNPDVLERVYNEGRKVMKENLEGLAAYLK